MTRPLRSCSLIFLILLLAACSPGDHAGSGPAAEASAGRGASATPHACDLLTADFVKSALGVTELSAEGTPRSTATYTSCSLVWPSDKKIEREIMGRTVTVDAENRISLTVSIFEPGNEQSAFNVGTNYLKDNYDSEPVEDVGDEALWVPDMDQLSVRGGGYVFHLSVNYPDGNQGDFEHTKHLARQILVELE